jgi:hypothetical protein
MSESTHAENKDKLARDLRVRLVREVAEPGFGAILLEQQIQCINDEINRIDTERKEFLETLSVECVACIEKEMLGISFMEIEEKYQKYVNVTSANILTLKKALEEKEEEKKAFNRTAHDALMRIAADVIAEKYGRGEIKLTQRGIERIIGRIEELEETTHQLGINLNFSQHWNIGVRQVAQMCENQKQQPPIFHLDIRVMPMTKEEATSLCREQDDFQLLFKHIPDEYFFWGLNAIYCLYRNPIVETYAICVHERECVIVRVEIKSYPRRVITQLGKLEANLTTFADAHYWSDISDERCSKVFGSVSDSEQALAFSMMAHHICDNTPGLYVNMPQLEKK